MTELTDITGLVGSRWRFKKRPVSPGDFDADLVVESIAGHRKTDNVLLLKTSMTDGVHGGTLLLDVIALVRDWERVQ